MSDYTELQIQFRLDTTSSAGSTTSTHEVVASVEGTGSWRGRSTIDYAELDQLAADPRQYGKRLGEIICNPAVMNALRQARGIAERPVRIRLWLEMGENGERGDHHGLRWERAFVTLNDKDWPLAIAPEFPFSRYVPTQAVDAAVGDDQIFQLLIAFANPVDLPSKLSPVDVENELSSLLDSIDLLAEGRRFRLVVAPGRSGISPALRARLAKSSTTLVEGPSTIDVIARAVQDCHGLHIVAHGTMNPQTELGALVLEDADGRPAFARDDDLNPWVHPRLRVVVLQSCQSAAPTPKRGRPFVGIGPRLVQLGVPAVIAMQDYVAMSDARLFAGAFYRSLVRDGMVDVAVNDGRRAIFQKSSNDNFSIPALFMRLRSGRLWCPDPLRSAVVAKLAELGPQPEHPLPTRAIHSLGTSLEYDSDVGPAGALFDMPAHLAELDMSDRALILLVGPRGMAKGSQIKWLYRRLATAFLEADGTAPTPAPVSLMLRDVVAARGVSEVIEKTLASGRLGPERPLVLIVDGDEEIGPEALREGLRLLRDFREGSRHPIIISFDEGLRAVWNDDLQPTAVLVTRPMEFDRVCQYLKRLQTPSATSLRTFLEERRCRDLASAPWLLERMLVLSERKVAFESRATLLRQIANQCLTSVSMAGVPRPAAERALERIAWEMQQRRESTLGGGDLYEILADVRGNREFRLGELKQVLAESSILTLAGDDAVRFRYQSLRAYYAARYLMAAPDRGRLIEDITASLGRLSRVRWWEKTLITLMGIDARGSEDLLQDILAGSSLIEGEQVYLAAQCFLDARKPGAPPGPIVDQLVDALIWRSHPENLRPYGDRKRAASVLAELRHPNAIPHLISLAAEPIATGWGTEKRYEFSGIRLIAVKGLILMQEEAKKHVRDHLRELDPVLDAWWTAYENGNLDGLITELKRANKATSPIAAFALGFFEDDKARQTLCDAFADPAADPDIGWAIADTFATLDPQWVSENVIATRLTQFDDPRIPYLIGRMGMAPEGSDQRNYLAECFAKGIPAVQARALRARGALRDASIRELCEAVVRDAWDDVRRMGLNLPATLEEHDRNRVRNAAMESLREVGDAHSIEALRGARRHGGALTITLRQLSFDVAEDIYWRLTGGMSAETFERNA